MRNALRRLAFGILGTGMIAAMALGATTVAASAAVSAPNAPALLHATLKWPTVRRGDYGAQVRTIQYLLNGRGYHLTVDGLFGIPTELAVKDFQKKKGLKVDGIVGSQTWPKLIITVKKGDKGYAVRGAQDQLRYEYGYTYVVVDGTFGAKTDTAVRDFQHRYSLKPVDGVVGPVTWNALVVHDR
jgi:peptidoglycan hydrolase-like protein with peptidoglycan-binding domain